MLPIDPMAPRLYAVGKPVKQRFGIGRTMQYKLIKSGELRAVRIGNRNYVTHEDGEAYLRNLPLARTSGRAA